MSLRNGIILEQKRLIFWYVPKNACTSIKKVLADALHLEYKNPHSAAFTVISPNDAHQFDGFRQVAVVRNPFDRLVSCYLDKIRPGVRNKGFPQGVEYTMTGYGFHELMTFDAFANRIFTAGIRNDHWAPQHTLLPDSQYLELIRFEEMGKVLPELLFQYGISAPLPRLNRTKRKQPYQSYYSDWLKMRALEYYEQDCKQYGYGFN